MTPEREALVARLREVRDNVDIYHKLTTIDQAIAALTAQGSVAKPVATGGKKITIYCGDELILAHLPGGQVKFLTFVQFLRLAWWALRNGTEIHMVKRLQDLKLYAGPRGFITRDVNEETLDLAIAALTAQESAAEPVDATWSMDYGGGPAPSPAPDLKAAEQRAAVAAAERDAEASERNKLAYRLIAAEQRAEAMKKIAWDWAQGITDAETAIRLLNRMFPIDAALAEGEKK